MNALPATHAGYNVPACSSDCAPLGKSVTTHRVMEPRLGHD